MSDTLSLLAELRTVLLEGNSQTIADRAWGLFQAIEGDLALDPRHSDQERALVRQLHSGVSDVIVAHRDGLNPHTGPAQVAISGLEGSIKRRSTGADGYPLA